MKLKLTFMSIKSRANILTRVQCIIMKYCLSDLIILLQFSSLSLSRENGPINYETMNPEFIFTDSFLDSSALNCHSIFQC